MTFGERLKYLREENGYTTRKKFAEKLGIPDTTLRNYETNVREPGHTFLIQMSDFFNVSTDYLLGLTCEKEKSSPHQLKTSEYEHIKKYRGLDDTGRKHIDIIMDWETFRVQQLQKAETTVIDFQSHTNGHLVTYYRSASAGTGVFILGNEASEQLSIPDTPENRLVDYAIGVSGDSMEPDYHDGDIVLVSQRVEMYHGDVGIFIINNKAYIKEYGETELISRNPDAPSIQISEYDNIVCMGKVIGKL